MAKGPPPTPTALRVIRGNPGRRPLNDAEPVIIGAAEMPEHLRGRPASLWSQYAPPLIKAGVLTAADVYMMAVWCELAAAIEAQGAAQMNFRMLAQFRAISGELGMTPASRGRIRAVAPLPSDHPFERFFDDRTR